MLKEVCLLGSDDVPSLTGDMVLLNRLVMLWQLLWTKAKGEVSCRNLSCPVAALTSDSDMSRAVSSRGLCSVRWFMGGL